MMYLKHGYWIYMKNINRIKTQIGIFELKIKKNKLYNVNIIDFENKGEVKLIEGEFNKFSDWLIRYFKGEILENLSKDDFILTESAVLNRILLKLLEFPYGKTLTYSDLALMTNTHPRVVGMAMAKNPVPIFIPCHRVLGKKSLGNYSMGGMEIKKWLLDFERNNLRNMKI